MPLYAPECGTTSNFFSFERTIRRQSLLLLLPVAAPSRRVVTLFAKQCGRRLVPAPTIMFLKLKPFRASRPPRGVPELMHIFLVFSAWGTLGATLCMPAPTRARQSYLSADTLHLVAMRKAWRQRLREVRVQTTNRSLALGFLGWQCMRNAFRGSNYATSCRPSAMGPFPAALDWASCAAGLQVWAPPQTLRQGRSHNILGRPCPRSVPC